jgi:D-3-phosphoglycerate dehydrogenase / 2-oxoglutarate reductase
MNILIAEPLAAAGIELFRSQPDWNVIVSNPKEYAQHLETADALLVRSAVQVNQAVLARAPKLKVVGRAGVGVDNVDLDAATEAGVLVMNTPGGNAISVAEHTFALMLAMARRIPQANASTRSGKWEKKKFLGNELRGKTLGIIGLGSIGREVVKRARAFDMRIVAHDPYVTSKIAQDLGAELLPLPDLYAASDYITLHVAATPETTGMLSREAFAQMKPGVRIVNCARGELVDEAALNEAIAAGTVVDAALDVFSTEPPPAGFPLFAIHAVNMPALSPEQYRALGPYAKLAERLGAFAAYIATGNPRRVKLTYFGKIADGNTNLLRNAGLAGLLSRSSQKVNLINAMQTAEQRGWSIAEGQEQRSTHTDSIRIELETESGVTSVEGVVFPTGPRLTQVDGIYCELALDGFLVFMKNQDVPGVIGHVGTVLGRNRINIANFSLGRREAPASASQPREAIALVATDEFVSEPVLAQLRANPAVKLARSVEFR